MSVASRLSATVRPEHHPSTQVMADYAHALVSPGVALAAEVHLAFCDICAMRLKTIEGAANRTGARPGVVIHGGSADRRAVLPPQLERVGWPALLQSLTIGTWRSVGAGLEAARVDGVSGLGEQVYMVRAEEGVPVWFGEGSGVELVVVVEGFAAAEAPLRPGEFLLPDPGSQLNAIVAGFGSNVCLVVAESELRLVAR